MPMRAGCLAVLLLVIAVPALAQKTVEYRAIGDAPAILYDAPAVRGRKLFVAPRGMPFEVVVSIEGWIKVRDRAGDMAWLERRLVGERRTVVSVATAQVREKPDDAAPLLLEVAGDVLLELIETTPGTAGWARVRHRDGATGFVRVSQVWGL
jgi:SH3-like domain-containing protein